MILTDYYRFERSSGCKSKIRLDCTASTKSYNPFEAKSFLYIGTADRIKASRHRKADLAVTSGKGEHITSIFSTEIKKGFDYGDYQGTTDLLLLVSPNFNIEADGRITDGVVFEIFVARGKKYEKGCVINLWADGQLNAEMERLRQQAD
jgi:hypothetical protein